MFSLFSCEKNDTSQEEELANLQELKTEIINLSESVTCEDSNNWSFTAIGHKACGGPTGYIAYANNIDVEYFLSLVSTYTATQKAYNQKWGIVSDCSLPQKPNAVICKDDTPVFKY